MANKENIKIDGYNNLLDKGVELMLKAQVIIDDPGMLPPPYRYVYVSLVVEYYKWKDDIWQFLKLKNKVEASFFKEIDNIPTIEQLEKHNQLDDIDFTPAFAEMILEEVKKKLERIREIARQNSTKKELSNKEFWITKSKNGEYFFDGNYVDIKSKDANYVIIFDVVFSLTPKGGKILYKEILNECKKRKLKIKKNAILRALTGDSANFFRYVKDVLQSPSNGIELFRAKQDGKYLEFNNKK